MTGNSKTDMRETHLLGAAGELAGMLYRWNVIDEYDLVIENSTTGTPYHHVTTALWKILLLLGVKNPESKMSFYEMVTSGMTPAEAVSRIKENESFHESEV
jgi:hypothetical protein